MWDTVLATARRRFDKNTRGALTEARLFLPRATERDDPRVASALASSLGRSK